MDLDQIRKPLRLFLKVVAIFMFLYWGIGQLLAPALYHSIIGTLEFNPLSGYDVFVTNLVGALVIGISYATWLAADDPVKNIKMIQVIFITGALVLFVYLVNFSLHTMAAINWIDAVVLAILLLVLIVIYPQESPDQEPK